jgi:NADH-quinone oxidoreductase subunit E
MAASNVAIIRGDTSLQTRVSSLATMTPESVEAAVQQAGSGLVPVRLDGPKGAPDDLTLISGVTEQSQRLLNELGIYHFWQVAGWTPEHVAWLSSRVDGPGRIARENWMSQAAKLAEKI